MKFKIGDIVRCLTDCNIDSEFDNLKLKCGCLYTVASAGLGRIENVLQVRGNDLYWWLENDFELVQREEDGK